MNLEHLKTGIIACICEGGAETAIMNILLDNDLLLFDREQLINREVLPRISVKEFQRQYLRTAYDDKISILRVIDSRSEQFKLRAPYNCQVKEIVNVITAPEIEILIIVNEGHYQKFTNSNIKKPSDYVKQILKFKSFKTQELILEYFSDSGNLINCIREYHRLHKQKNNEASIYDLLKLDNQR